MLRWRFCACVLVLACAACDPDVPVRDETGLAASNDAAGAADAAESDAVESDAANDTAGGSDVWCGTQKTCMDNTCAANCAPKIAVHPTALTFASAPFGAKSHATLTIRNDGHEPLSIGSVALVTSHPGLSIDDIGGFAPLLPQQGEILLKTPLMIAAGSQQDVKLSAETPHYNPVTGTLTLFSNDPAAASGTIVPLALNQPCLQVVPGDLVFGGTPPGSVDDKSAALQNLSEKKVCVTGIALTAASQANSPFSLDFSTLQNTCPLIDAATGPTPDQPCCLAPGKAANFHVLFAPKTVSAPQQPLTATLQVSVDSPTCPPAFAGLSGAAVNLQCPVAKIDITEGDEVVPQTTLHLKGDGSKGGNGVAIKTYKWTAKQPAGSNKGFNPSSTFPNPTFTPDASGEYEFCLEVTDSGGVKSCAQACQKVLVVPNNAVHIELLWDTPADPDQTDTGPAAGADMDLHFANYLASGPDIDCDGTGDPWLNNPFDCFWFNNSPQWGSSNPAIKDDPTLDLDDTDGAGPENLNLEHPEGDPALPRFYSIGAHYWNDHGYGVSSSTITVYLFGAVALKIDQIFMNPLDMWYVGKLNWPNQLTGTSMPPFTVCYQTKGSKPGDVCAGTAKMWQSTGEWCITPCYVNPTFAATTGGATPSNCKPMPKP